MLERDLEFRNGEILTVHFKYEKLDCYYKRCYRLTHDKHSCPERPLARQSRGSRRYEGDRRRKDEQVGVAQGAARDRRHHHRQEEKEEIDGSLVLLAKQQVRRNLFGGAESLAVHDLREQSPFDAPAQTWARKTGLSGGEDKALGKRPRVDPTGDSPVDYPARRTDRTARRRNAAPPSEVLPTGKPEA
ncbi:unnamed protein product [Arabis nemorensis]|uniref:Zinc knuckle CX2CX4HX4C domain-containing protein n=1 Tax=Arabis nemorensis TaxID=586526 RepID=A0A565B0W1_9BRAS|nr:unnamed protein product [Arabis nemorensis]